MYQGLPIDWMMTETGLPNREFQSEEIRTYGVGGHLLPSSFWKIFNSNFLNTIPEELIAVAEELMENTSAEAFYHTAWDIINSEEFSVCYGNYAETSPEIILEGLISVLHTFGWCHAIIHKIIPNQMLAIRVYDMYQSPFSFTSLDDQSFNYILKGILRSFMDVVYPLSHYPEGFGRFKCDQTESVLREKRYNEFIVYC